MANKLLELFTKSASEPKKASEAAEMTTDPGSKKKEDEGSLSNEQRLKKDIEELLQLFPKMKANAIPDEVWQRVENGDSLCAAYCLWLVKRAKEENRIRQVNERLSKTAPPQLSQKGEGGEYFTKETVKNMSPEQVRKNLDAILRSMDSWK